MALRRLVDLLGMKLARLASPHELHGVVERRGPVEAAAEGLAHEGAGRRMVPVIPTMDVSNQLTSLFPRDAL